MVEEGPCRMLLFVTWKSTALMSQLHGSDKSLFFQEKKNFSVPSFSRRQLRESIEASLWSPHPFSLHSEWQMQLTCQDLA